MQVVVDSGMQVKQLIAQLLQMDPEARVVGFWKPEGGTEHVFYTMEATERVGVRVEHPDGTFRINFCFDDDAEPWVVLDLSAI